MFYSHTFLARKGPLGTVWCAAHLQHKLKKSHYTSTNIPSTVERIMYPEVPIALRMSSHLLLGVVRIYSKQVEYLYHDCTVVMIGIRKAFATVEINLPEDASQAPFHSVTLPQTFELDALDLDDNLYEDRFEDNHMGSHEDITLADQVPTERDYIVITFDEEIPRDISNMEDFFRSGPSPMEEDSRPSVSEGTNGAFRDPGPSDQTGADERPNEDSVPQNIPDIEVMRDAAHDFHLNDVPFLPDQGNDIPELEKTLELQKEKEILSPVREELVSEEQPLPAQHYQEPASAASGHTSEIFDLRSSFGHVSPELALRSTPPVEQPKARHRKRKNFYDETTVLTNEFMKKQLEDTNYIQQKLKRKRKQRLCDALDVWKVNNGLKMDKVFLDPLLTGLSADLSDIFKKDFIFSKPHLVPTEAARTEPTVSHSSSPENQFGTEIEHLRDNAGPMSGNILPEVLTSPNIFLHSPIQGNDFTPAFTVDIDSVSYQMGTNIGAGALPTPDLSASTRTVGSEIETPMTVLEERLGVGNSGLSDIPELLESSGDLNFLEEEDNTPAGLLGTPGVGNSPQQRGTPEIGSLSARARAVAQYLKKQSSATPISEELSGDLSLKKILEGKRKKLCARMFFETLVLKNSGLVDLQQEQPYGDISVKVTPKLLKEQFSS